MTTTISTITLGEWRHKAQSAVDALSHMTDVEQVTARFHTARSLTEEVLGYPVAGGHATKRAIRAVGVLLHHHLAPALVGEALALAASVADLVETPIVESLLEAAATAELTWRPASVIERSDLHGLLERSTSTARRRRLVLDAWTERRLRTDLFDTRRAAADAHCWSDWFRSDEDASSADEVEAWLRSLGTPADTTSPPAVALIDRLRSAAAAADELSIIEGASAWEVSDLAARGPVDELGEAAQAVLLRGHPRDFVNNPRAPRGLLAAAREPYDLATLELALCTGLGRPQRMRRWMTRLSEDDRRDLARRHLSALLRALRDADVLDATDLVDGPLAAVDVSRRREVEQVFGRLPWTSPPPGYLHVLRSHPDRQQLAWTLDLHHRGWLAEADAALVVAEQDGELRRAAVRHLPANRIPAGLGLTVEELASSPAIPAVERPRRDPASVRPRRHSRPSEPPTRFHYPASVRRIDGHVFACAPAWRATLPRDDWELTANADVMGNCTGTYTDLIEQGDAWIVVLRMPDGSTYNVGLRRRGGRIDVTQIAARWNEVAHEAEWARDAIARLLAAPLTTPAAEPCDLPPPGRRPSDRRDRRRRRAQAHRRARR